MLVFAAGLLVYQAGIDVSRGQILGLCRLPEDLLAAAARVLLSPVTCNYCNKYIIAINALSVSVYGSLCLLLHLIDEGLGFLGATWVFLLSVSACKAAGAAVCAARQRLPTVSKGAQPVGMWQAL